MPGGKGVAYGFLFSGQEWNMVYYDGSAFRTTLPRYVGLHDLDKPTWMQKYSMLVDLMYYALIKKKPAGVSR